MTTDPSPLPSAAMTEPIIAVGDSSSDLPMLDLAVGRAIVVNPTTSMQDADRARGGRFTLVNYGSGA